MDERKIKAIGYYYCIGSSTYGKKIESCKKAGYSDSHSEQRSGGILEIDSFKDTMRLEWKKFEGNLIYLNEMVRNWLLKHKDAPEVKDIREAFKGIRAIGDSMGKFIKREEKITHNIEEKREIKVFITLEEKRKYALELIAMGNQMVEETKVEAAKSG